MTTEVREAGIAIGCVNQKFIVTSIETFRCIECFVLSVGTGSFANSA